MPETFKALANLLQVDPQEIMIHDPKPKLSEQEAHLTVVSHESGAAHAYFSWKDLDGGAKRIAQEIYSDSELKVDVILTFPGPSSIFCGLVLAKLPPEIFMCIPVYTAIFIDAETHISREQRARFQPLNCKFFKVLIPLELLHDTTKRIMVVDDVVISGGFIKKMRTAFKKSRSIQFACCVCYRGRTFLTEAESKPDLVALPFARDEDFEMPWGLKAFSFEDVFHARRQMLKKLAELKDKN